MSQIQSDNFLFTNPKPPQQWQRKLVSGTTYTDWASSAEVDTFFATTTGLDPSYKINKDFWIAGKLYNFDGSTYREIGGSDVSSAVQSMNYTVTMDGMTVTIAGLVGKTLVLLFFVGQFFDNEQIPLDSGTGTLNGTYAGGFYDGNYLTILYK